LSLCFLLQTCGLARIVVFHVWLVLQVFVVVFDSWRNNLGSRANQSFWKVVAKRVKPPFHSLGFTLSLTLRWRGQGGVLPSLKVLVTWVRHGESGCLIMQL